MCTRSTSPACRADPELVAALAGLPGRKIVHTNGSERHAERLLDHLGIADSFCGIFDIAAAEFDPKPALAGYQRCCAATRSSRAAR